MNVCIKKHRSNPPNSPLAANTRAPSSGCFPRRFWKFPSVSASGCAVVAASRPWTDSKH